MSEVSNIRHCTYIRRNLLISGGHLELIWYWHCPVMNRWTWILDGQKRNACRISWGNLLRNVHLEEREGDRRITFTWSFGTYSMTWLELGCTMLCSLLCVLFSLWILQTHWLVSYYYIYLPVDCETVAIRKALYFVVMERSFRSLFSSPVLSVAWRRYRLLQTGQHYRTK